MGRKDKFLHLAKEEMGSTQNEKEREKKKNCEGKKKKPVESKKFDRQIKRNRRNSNWKNIWYLGEFLKEKITQSTKL